MLHPLASMNSPDIVPQVSPELLSIPFAEEKMITLAWLEHLRSQSQLCIYQPYADLVASSFEYVINALTYATVF